MPAPYKEDVRYCDKTNIAVKPLKSQAMDMSPRAIKTVLVQRLQKLCASGRDVDDIQRPQKRCPGAAVNDDDYI